MTLASLFHEYRLGQAYKKRESTKWRKRSIRVRKRRRTVHTKNSDKEPFETKIKKMMSTFMNQLNQTRPKPRRPVNRKSPQRCYKCQGTGHFQKESSTQKEKRAIALTHGR